MTTAISTTNPTTDKIASTEAAEEVIRGIEYVSELARSKVVEVTF